MNLQNDSGRCLRKHRGANPRKHLGANHQNHCGRQMGRRLLILMLAVITAASMVTALPAAEASAASAPKAKTLKYEIKPSMKSLTVSWKKQKQVSYYLIYRTEYRVSNYYDIEPVPMSKFKKIKKVSGKKTSWTDKQVKKGRYYNYVIKGFRKSGGKAKLVCNSFRPTATYYDSPGLMRPDLLDGGTGENYANSKDELYLYVQRDKGVRPEGVEICRKAEGADKYERIKVKKMEKGRFDAGADFRDSSVKPGKTYYYKARTWVKKKGKKTYSPFSNAVCLQAVNLIGKYSARAMTAAGMAEEFSVCLTSDKYNGNLILKGGDGEDGPFYEAADGSKTYSEQKLSLVSWSRDNETWQEIPSEGLHVKAGQTLYLKFRFVSGSSWFQAGSGGTSLIDFNCCNVSYIGTDNFGWSSIMIDLIEGTASAYPNADF